MATTLLCKLPIDMHAQSGGTLLQRFSHQLGMLDYVQAGLAQGYPSAFGCREAVPENTCGILGQPVCV